MCVAYGTVDSSSIHGMWLAPNLSVNLKPLNLLSRKLKNFGKISKIQTLFIY